MLSAGGLKLNYRVDVCYVECRRTETAVIIELKNYRFEVHYFKCRRT